MVSLVGLTSLLAAVVALLAATVLGLRSLREARERRGIERRATLLPAVRALLADPNTTPDDLAAFWRRSGAPESVASLLLDEVRALGPGPRAVVTGAFEAVGRVDRDLAALRSRRWWVRAAAADRLRRLAVPRAAEPLLERLRDRHEEVRLVAARALADLGDARVVRPLLASLSGSSRWAAIQAAAILTTLGPAAADTLTAVLREEATHAGGDPRRLRLLLDGLAEAGNRDAAGTVAAFLSHRDPDIRARAARVLGRLGAPGAARVLRQALDDPAWPVRAQAAAALLEAPLDAGTLDALALRLSDSAYWVRLNAAETLGYHADRRARQRLAAALRSPDPFACQAALRVLGASAGLPRAAAAGE
ncbi:MAG TPA: HEAT repeat domain-containing protein [Thermodesulfobacteriota bacterium]